jgi:hypothetical protein
MSDALPYSSLEAVKQSVLARMLPLTIELLPEEEITKAYQNALDYLLNGDPQKRKQFIDGEWVDNPNYNPVSDESTLSNIIYKELIGQAKKFAIEILSSKEYCQTFKMEPGEDGYQRVQTEIAKIVTENPGIFMSQLVAGMISLSMGQMANNLRNDGHHAIANALLRGF